MSQAGCWVGQWGKGTGKRGTMVETGGQVGENGKETLASGTFTRGPWLTFHKATGFLTETQVFPAFGRVLAPLDPDRVPQTCVYVL